MKKSIRILKNIFSTLITLVAICMMVFTIISVSTFDRNDRKIFGYKMFIVLSDSMSATDFNAGDLIFVKEVDPAALQEGDIISYQSSAPENYGEVVTHKIRTRTTDAQGNPGFITYGTTTGTDDEIVVTYEFVLGQYQGNVPSVGKFFQFLKTTPGYIVCILVPFLLLILMQGINSIKLFKQYKAEQQEELNTEKQKLEAEREQTQKMMEELTKMRAELAQKEATHSDKE